MPIFVLKVVFGMVLAGS